MNDISEDCGGTWGLVVCLLFGGTVSKWFGHELFPVSRMVRYSRQPWSVVMDIPASRYWVLECPINYHGRSFCVPVVD